MQGTRPRLFNQPPETEDNFSAQGYVQCSQGFVFKIDLPGSNFQLIFFVEFKPLAWHSSVTSPCQSARACPSVSLVGKPQWPVACLSLPLF